MKYTDIHSFVVPMESGSEFVLGEIVTVYYRNNGDITFDAPVE